MIFVLAPFAEKKGFLNENELPQQEEVIKYILLCLPVVISYIVLASIYIRKITFLRSLNYPFYIANIYIGLCLSIIVMGGAILWVMIPTIIIPLLALPVSFFTGLIKDIKYLNKPDM
ncbi:hypothetical protein [Cohnella kolymensis]|nr:hypothetical protein [Cohnella kolymensis]